MGHFELELILTKYGLDDDPDLYEELSQLLINVYNDTLDEAA